MKPDIVQLKHNMRNSENVINASLAIGNYEKEEKKNTSDFLAPNKTLSGPVNYHYHNIHMLDPASLVKAVILKYFSNNPNVTIVVLIDTVNQEENLEPIFKGIKRHMQSLLENIVYLPNKYSDESNTYIEQVRKFLDEPNGILVTHAHLFNGAQARNIIKISLGKSDNTYLRNLILRSMTFCISVTQKEVEVRNVPGLVNDLDLHKYIQNTEDMPSCFYYKLYLIH